MRVLYVEDDPVNLCVMRAMLTRSGASLVEAHDGQAGLDAVEAGNFDVVLMDLRMPVMDGLTAIRHIRRRPDAKAHLPIICVTADVTPEAHAECLAAGAQAVVYKPIDFKLLWHTMGEVLLAPPVSCAA